MLMAVFGKTPTTAGLRAMLFDMAEEGECVTELAGTMETERLSAGWPKVHRDKEHEQRRDLSAYMPNRMGRAAYLDGEIGSDLANGGGDKIGSYEGTVPLAQDVCIIKIILHLLVTDGAVIVKMPQLDNVAPDACGALERNCIS